MEIAWEATEMLALESAGCPELLSPLEGFRGVGR